MTGTQSIYATLLAAGLVGLAGCGSSNSGDPVIGLPETGTTFSDVSSLLQGSPPVAFARGAGEGYGGIAWLDYDVDDDLDILLTNEKGYSSALLRNNGDGTFTNVTIEAKATIMSGNSGVVVGDIDNDGYPDIFMSGAGFFAGESQSPTVLLHNLGNGTFEDISATAGVPGAETALSAAFGDINNDGLVDLFIASEGHLFFLYPPGQQHTDRLYLNNGDLTFTDITVAAGVTGGQGSCVASFSHFDNDEFIDLFVGVCNNIELTPTPWHVYRNNGNSTFTDVAATTGLDLAGYWMSSAFGDIDNDGDFDIFATNLGGGATHKLWRNNGDGTYVEIGSGKMTDDSGVNYWGWGATFADFDNDGFQDLYYGGEQPGLGRFGQGNPGYLFFNEHNSRFRLDQAAFGVSLLGRGVTGIARADYDGDGFVDLAIMTARTGANPVAEPLLMRNNGNGNHAVSIRLAGTTSNRMAIGARIEVRSNAGVFQAQEVWAGSSFASSESPWPVFGLGQATSVDATVYWPSGLVESFPKLAAGGLRTLVEGEGKAL